MDNSKLKMWLENKDLRDQYQLELEMLISFRRILQQEK